MTRGGLKFPCELVANAVLTTEIVLAKLATFVGESTHLNRATTQNLHSLDPTDVAHVLHTSQVAQTRLLASDRGREICSRHPEFVEHGRSVRWS